MNRSAMMTSAPRMSAAQGLAVTVSVGLSLGALYAAWLAAWMPSAAMAVLAVFAAGISAHRVAWREAALAGAGLALLVACALPGLKPWVVPQQPMQWLQIMPLTATVFAAGVLGLCLRAALSGEARMPLPGVLAVLAAPLLFNALLTLAAGGFAAQLAAQLGGTGRYAPQLGRTLLLWAIGEVLVLGCGALLDRRLPRGLRVHALMLFAAAYATATPLIADAGSTAALANASVWLRLPALVLSAAFAQAGLWGITFLLTGVLLDSLHGRRPTWASLWAPWRGGAGKGAVYGGVFVALIQLAALMLAQSWFVDAFARAPLPISILLGAVLFPLARTLVESFDGSAPFFGRLRRAYAQPMNPLRGLIAGAGLALALAHALPAADAGKRFLIAGAIGAASFGGADLLRDIADMLRGRRQRLQSLRVYVFGAICGAVVAGALGWYFDAPQLQVVVDKFHRYALTNFAAGGSTGFDSVVYPLFSKWGAIPLGHIDGGVALLYSESLGGVINWAIAAPLFSLNLVALTAIFRRSLQPLRELLTPAGVRGVIEQTVRVLRWGPWMAPIISSFLRMAPQPAWYNQDGLVRTGAAILQSLHLPQEAFRKWGLDVFLGLLAYDWLRILIWFDHMGLRVATLVNLSFVGADALDEKAARGLGHAGRTRVIPEGIRRFLTWAPLLIPFFIPRGGDWNYAWDGAEALAKNAQAPLLPAVATLMNVYAAAGLVGTAGLLWLGSALWLSVRARRGVPAAPLFHELSNGQYTLALAADGRGWARCLSEVRQGFVLDLTRQPDDPQQLRGKFFLFRDADHEGLPWSLTPQPLFHPHAQYRHAVHPASLDFGVDCAGVAVDASVSIEAGAPVERWTLRLRNLESRPRVIELTSYQELAVGPTDQYRRTPFFAAMHVGTAFVRPLGAILARNRLMRTSGPAHAQRIAHELAFHAVREQAGAQLIGYEDSRSSFIGAGTLRAPDALTMPLREPGDEGLLYSFDPAASLRLRVTLPAQGSIDVDFLDGYAKNEVAAAALIAERFGTQCPESQLQQATTRERVLAVPPLPPGFDGEAEFSEDGREVRAPAEALRPWTHVLANPLGHGAVVSSDGEIYSFAGNAQQNGLGVYALDSLPTQTPSQVLHVHDLDTGESLTPGWIPHRHGDAQREVIFGLGWACFRQRRGTLALEYKVFVPPELPLEMRLLRVRNEGTRPLRLRVAPFIDLAMAEAGSDGRDTIEIRTEQSLGAVLFRRPVNDFRKGWGFLSLSLDVLATESVRTRYFGVRDAAGIGGDACAPHFVRFGGGDSRLADDGRRVAALCGEVQVAPGETREIGVLLGQAPTLEAARQLVQQWRGEAAVLRMLQETRRWWNMQLDTLRVETDNAAFDRLVNDWLPYQLLTARLWGRCGPQQRSGAFGYRDQLQDVMPLAVLEPLRARAQILLHAAQQFREGDAPKWWHPAWDGGTGICVRTAASDPQLWLPWVVAHYIEASGDPTLLHESVPFMEAQPLPRGQEGTMFVPRPSMDRGSVYEHCRRAIDWSLDRLGAHGLPLLGSGDWNDGIDLPGLQGRGESVWLGFFLHAVLQRMLPYAQGADATRWRQAATQLAAALAPQWDARQGYLRAYTDEGAPLRTCDALMTAWPALSGAVDAEHGIEALQLGLAQLMKPDRVLLLTPPFAENAQPYPGRIAEYPPGVRENGGQYSHGSSWIVDALMASADAVAASEPARAQALREQAFAVWTAISPLGRHGTQAWSVYGLPPHQQPADIYDGAGHAGRGGWAWYTGAAARMLVAAHALLGIRFRDGEPQLTGASAVKLRSLRFRGRPLPLP